MVAPDVSSPLAVQEFTSTKTKDVQMTDATLSLTAAPTYEGTNRLILGIVLKAFARLQSSSACVASVWSCLNAFPLPYA